MPDLPRLHGRLLASRPLPPGVTGPPTGPGGAVRVLQVGEGRFMRGFFDWILQQLVRQAGYDGRAAVINPRPAGGGVIADLVRQSCLFTVVLRSSSEDRVEICASVARALDPYRDPPGLMELVTDPNLDIVVSNTTEAGLVGSEPAHRAAEPVTFPARLCLWLFERWRRKVRGGLTVMPLELVPGNGRRLRAIVEQEAGDRGLDAGFRRWLDAAVEFPSTLVDRIVTGFPPDAERWFARLGYRDALLTVGESHHRLWIESTPGLERRLPFGSTDLKVRAVADIRPYEAMKVRMLNGAHITLAALGDLAGRDTVAAAMRSPALAAVVEAYLAVAAPTVPLPPSEVAQFGGEVLERLRAPWLEHALAAILENAVQKWELRVLPVAEAVRAPAAPLTLSLAALVAHAGLRRGSCERGPGGRIQGPLAAQWHEGPWARWVEELPGFAQAVAADLEGFAAHGVEATCRARLAAGPLP